MMLRIVVTNRQKGLRFSAERVRRAARIACGGRWRSGTASVVVVGGQEMAQLNRRHTGRAGETDVLAFDLRDLYDPAGVRGEIVVNANRALEEARRRKIRAADELTLYVVHGMLHLIGYDDHCAGERKRMYSRETKALAALRIPDIRSMAIQPRASVRRRSKRGTGHA